MKRRILSLLLCIVMVLTSVFAASCGTAKTGDGASTETGEQSSIERSSMTLTLWMPVEEGTTEEALELVEEAINKITQTKFDTAIKLYGIPTDDYEDAVQTQMADIKERIDNADKLAIERRKAEREAAKKGETLGPEWYTDADEEIENPYDLIVDSAAGYPHVENNQMDIFLVRGYDDYKDYIDSGEVVSLNEQLAGASKILKSYIYTDFLDAATSIGGGEIFAIPNNHPVGNYKYLLVNKDLAEEMGYNERDLATLRNCQPFVERVAAEYPDVTPVYGDIEARYMQYWSGNPSDEFSVLASYVSGSTMMEDVEIENVFSISDFTLPVYLSKLYEEKGYINNDIDPTEDEFGMGIVESTPAEIEEYEDDYYVNIYEYPQGTLDEYCSSMFAVSAYTKSAARAMEIITYINTEEDSLRTILQYGVENEHWKYDESNPHMIVKKNDGYNMDLYETGNIYMTYPDYEVEVDFSVPKDTWVAEKQTNLDSLYPMTSRLTGYVHEGNAELVEEFDDFCEEIWEKIEEMDAETFNSSIDDLKREVENNEYFQKLSYMPSSTDEQKGRTPENGWVTDNSFAYMWNVLVFGEE